MTGQDPWLTVVIPARDAERTILTAVRSVLGQADSLGTEVIVVDDSRDGSIQELVQTLNDGRVRVVPGPGRGAGAARNAGLRAAGAAWVGLLDADDRWLPGHVGTLRTVLNKNPSVVACFGAARHVDDDGRLLRLFTPRPQHATVAGLLRRRLQPTTSATAVRRDAVLAVGGFYEGFRRAAGVEDIDLWWRVAEQGPCAVQRAPLCEYVVHLGRDTARSREELLELRADRRECIRRLRGAVPLPLRRIAAAQHHAVLARYWLLAGYSREARQDARRAIAYWPTSDGFAALALASLPLAISRAVRSFFRSAIRLTERV